jgi:hypothetical protein
MHHLTTVCHNSNSVHAEAVASKAYTALDRTLRDVLRHTYQMAVTSCCTSGTDQCYMR